MTKLWLSEIEMAPTWSGDNFNQYHYALARPFPYENGLRPFLFRVVPGGSARSRRVIVQSEAPPAVLQDPVLKVQRTVPLTLSYKTGELRIFEITASPVRLTNTVSVPLHDANGKLRSRKVMNALSQPKRRPVHGEEKQIEWLAEKLKDAAELVYCTIKDTQTIRFCKDSKRGQSPDIGKMLAVTFHGQLRVLDPEAMALLVRHGVGRYKFLGFGLLTTAPATAAVPV